MGYYRKKPVTIEAVQWPVGAERGEGIWREPPPQWLLEAFDNGVVTAHEVRGSDWLHATIKTLEGDHLCQPGDWIIKGVKGELYPCKPDIFAMTYEPAPPTQEGV